MDSARRQELRNARRQRRAQANLGTNVNTNALQNVNNVAYANAQSMPSGEGPTATAIVEELRASREVRGRTSLSDTTQLLEKVQQHKKEVNNTVVVLSEREALIQRRYAPNVEHFLNELLSSSQDEQSKLQNTTLTEAAYDFKKDNLLAALIAETGANFPKLDQELLEDGALATQRLYASVFSHANDFLTLFRDVDKACDLVEELKANVQGTKAAISAISKFNYFNIGDNNATCDSLLSSSVGSGKVMNLAGATSVDIRQNNLVFRERPSLVSRYLGGYDDCSSTVYKNSLVNIDLVKSSDVALNPHEEVRQGNSKTFEPSARTDPTEMSLTPEVPYLVGTAGARLFSTVPPSTAPLARPTTRSLNIESFIQWQYSIGGGRCHTNKPSATAAFSKTKVDEEAFDGTSPRANEREATRKDRTSDSQLIEVQVFSDLLREEIVQLLCERRYSEAAEILQSLGEDAERKGCLPLLLELESALARAILASLNYVPITMLYAESVHIPSLQLLVRFGRHKSASSAYLALQSSWLHRELRKLSDDADPKYAGVVTAEFLVAAMRSILERQHTLGMSFHEKHNLAAKSLLPVNEKNKNKQATSRVRPNSTAVLWVRNNVLHFACELLTPHVLSYGKETVTDEASQIRHAVVVLGKVMEVLYDLTLDGFAGNDTLTLQYLIPSLVVLQAEFTRLAEARFESIGRAMLECLVTSGLKIYEAKTAQYDPSICADTARRSSARSQELIHTLKAMANDPHMRTIELLLCPAASDLFDRAQVSALPNTNVKVNETKPITRNEPFLESARHEDITDSGGSQNTTFHSPLAPERFGFMRYATGCTSLHTLFMNFMLHFTAAMGVHESKTTPSGTCDNSHGPTKVSSPKGRRKNVADNAVHPHLSSEGKGAEKAEVGSNLAENRIQGRASLIFSDALITDTFDLGLHNLCVSFLCTSLRQQSALVEFLASDEYKSLQQKLFPLPPNASSSTRSLFFSDCARSPGWVFDGCCALLSDAMGVSVWVSYLVQGGAVGQLFGDSNAPFRSRHLENLRRILPVIVQSWLVTALCLGHNIDNAKGLLPASAVTLISSLPYPQFPLSSLSQKGNRATQDLRTTNGCTDTKTPAPAWSLTQLSRFRSGPSFNTLHSCSRSSNLVHNTGRGPLEASALHKSETCISKVMENDTMHRSDLFPNISRNVNEKPLEMNNLFKCGSHTATVSMPVLKYEGEDNRWEPKQEKDGTSPRSVNRSTAEAVSYLPLELPAAAQVDRRKLLPLLLELLDTKYCTPRDYKVHDLLISMGTSSFADAVEHNEGGFQTFSDVWVIRSALPSYPQFPLGEEFDRHDELFLFHWCVQICLHLLTIFQERFLVPSFALNQGMVESVRAQEILSQGKVSPATSVVQGVQYPVQGCVSPLDDGTLGGLCTGSGNYVAAISLLQFLVVRLLADVLCRSKTWNVVYACKSTVEWRNDERIGRQQLFFFALFMRFWSPLFHGGMRIPVQHRSKAHTPLPLKKNSLNSKHTIPDSPPSRRTNVRNDNDVSGLAVLEWLTTSGVLRQTSAALATPLGKKSHPSSILHSVYPSCLPSYASSDPHLLTIVDLLFSDNGGTKSTKASGVAGTTNLPPSVPHRIASQQIAQDSVLLDKNRKLDHHHTIALDTDPLVSNTCLNVESYLPSTLLSIVELFYQNRSYGARAMSALTSDLMRDRVDRALMSVNLANFVGTPHLPNEDKNDDEDTSMVECVTLGHLRDLLVSYIEPLL